MIKYLNSLQEKYGVFDWPNRPRDIAPDQHVERLGVGVIIFTLVRTLGPIALGYNWRDTAGSLALSWWSYPKMVAWVCVLDYVFYCYHRTTHVVDRLWSVHSLHHGTRSPTVLLSILAGDFQEFLEICFCPLMASLLVPCNLTELYIVSQYLGASAESHSLLTRSVFTEAMGHCGARADLTNPLVVYILGPLGLDIRLEDHDLHHRFGRAGQGYGKETAIWDTRGSRAL